MTKIEIRWLAVQNRNHRLSGWLPQVTVNGRSTMPTWSAVAQDSPDAAEIVAKEYADIEAQKYLGDYKVTISPAEPGK